MKRSINIWRSLDWITVFIYLTMIFFGWINIYAAVYNEEFSSIFDISQRYGKQIIWIGASLVIAALVIGIDSRFYLFFSYLFYIAVIAMLVLVLIFGKEVNGARSWFEIGGFSFQPSEFAKFVTALALARYLSVKGRTLNSYKTIFTSSVIILTPALLIVFQPDMGSALVYFALVLVLFREGLSPYLFITGILAILLFVVTLIVDNLYIYSILVILAILIHLIISGNPGLTLKGTLIMAIIGGAVFSVYRWGVGAIRVEQIFIISLLLAVAAFTYYIYRFKAYLILVIYAFLLGSMLFIFTVDYSFNNILKPHQQSRINVVLGIESDPSGSGYNLNQSKISIGSGGFTGKGFLQGTQTKFKFVPEQSTDFIFCTVGEEWGFLGTSFVILMFAFLFTRLIIIAERQRSSFSRIFGYGVVSILLFHFVINIGMTIGLVPVIGIPLPFFSYGGSSLWGFTLLLFIFLRLDASRNEYMV